ncbi:MAG: arsenate reductase (glutaredoxin) [Gammaproteobacteria bacterium]|nr:arsenate reductase (glutaredoxin) [Gammaproteobacteria bacterium]
MPTIYHNPRCSKSRATLALIEEKGVEPEVIEYLKAPLEQTVLRDIIEMLGVSPRDLLRTGEDEYKQLNLDNPELSDEKIIQIICAHPILLQRPIVVNGDKARIGRPPESVLEII